MSDNKPSAEIIAKWKSRVKDPNTDEKSKETFRNLLKKWGEDVEDVVKKVGEEVVGKKERKPRTTKPKTTKTSSADDIEKAKAELKKKTGKTEEECEAIIEQYRALRTKAQERKAKDEKASEDNKKRVKELDKKGDIIEGTNEKTADAVIETAKVEVVEKIEKEIEKVEAKAEVEAKREVEKEMPKESATEKKKAVAEKVEKKVKEKTKVVVKRVIVDTTSMIESIASKLAEFDKESQKEFLIKLRSDIDKLLTKFAFGGEVSGATQGYNITQSNMSSSSVNMFARGGGVNVGKYIVTAYDGKSKEFALNKKGLKAKNDTDVAYFNSDEADKFIEKHKSKYLNVNKFFIRERTFNDDVADYDDYIDSTYGRKYADGGLIEMFTDNDDEDYVNDELDDLMSNYDIDEETIEEIIRDRSITDVDDLKTYFENAYFTYAENDSKLADNYIEMLGSVSELGNNTLETYFDYKAFGRDLAYDYVEYNGHYFNNSYARGGNVNRGLSWHQDMKRHNKSEKYEIPMDKRKKMAQGGLTEHALEIGDTIVYNARPSNVIKVQAQNGKEYWVNLNLGKRMLTTEHTMANSEKNKDFFRMAKGGATSYKGRGANIDMAMHKRRGM